MDVQKYIYFYLTLGPKKKAEKATLQFLGPVSLTISMYPAQDSGSNHTSQFVSKIQISPYPDFPQHFLYNYSIDGKLLYPNPQKITISKYPNSHNIYVNDTEDPHSDKMDNKVSFFILAPQIPKGHSIFISFSSKLRMDWKTKVFKMEHAGDNIWFKHIDVSLFLNQTIVYKYLIVKEEAEKLTIYAKESGRPHTLILDSPLPNKYIHVYDTWAQIIPFFAFYPHPVKASESSQNYSLVKIEFTPQTEAKNVFIKGNTPFLSNIESLFPDGPWRRDMIVKSNDIDNCKFQFGVVEDIENGNLKWIGYPLFCFKNTSVKPDAIASNLYFGEAINRSFGIYIPLVSIPSSHERVVGDFGTLVDLAKWCKNCGIDFINVHIERIEGGLIDPIHLDININLVSIDNQIPNLLPYIRILKLNILKEEKFKNWNPEEDYEYKFFCQTNKRIINQCKSEFEKFVQYILFKQLFNAFAQVVDIGSQIVIDLFASNTLDEDLKLFSKYCQGIRIVGLSRYLKKLTVDNIRECFGSLTGDFLNSFCQIENNSQLNNVLLLETAYSPDFIKSFESKYSLDDADFTEKLNIIKSIYEESERNRFIFSLLKNIAQDCPATIFLDNASTHILSVDEVKNLNLASCSQSNDSEPDMVLIPNYLSPEKVSEFEEDALSNVIMEELHQRLLSTKRCIFVYLFDILKANGLSIALSPLQTIEHYQRYKFSISVNDLLGNYDLNNQIQSFLFSAKRSI